MNARILFAWIGNADRKGSQSQQPDDLGPIARALDEAKNSLGAGFNTVYLLDDHDDKASKGYVDWLTKRFSGKVEPCLVVADKTNWDPGSFEAVWREVMRVLDQAKKSYPEAKQFYLGSSGTLAMGTVWALASRTRPYQGTLLQASREKGLEEIELSFMNLEYATPSKAAQRTYDRATRRSSKPSSKWLSSFVAVETKMQEVVEQARRFARFDLPVLLLGENGTGKEIIANFIHKESGREGTFIAINCGALPSDMVESELFGHTKGAFTGAINEKTGLLKSAGQGTVFLDEIADLPLPSQVKLLRALQEKKIRRVGDTKEDSINCRFIAATNKSLHEEIAKNTFREDLYYRIAGCLIKIPPLRERPEDLRALIESLWQEITKNSGLAGQTLEEEAVRCLLDHNWPGNVRELNYTLVRAAVSAERPSVSKAVVEAALDRRIAPLGDDFDVRNAVDILNSGGTLNLGEYLATIEKKILDTAYKKTKKNKTQAGHLLGLTKATMGNKIKNYGL